MGKFVRLSVILCSDGRRSFDNSGQKMSFPHWHSNQTNVDRTDAIIKTIANMFAGSSNVVPVIAPLNEYVRLTMNININ